MFVYRWKDAQAALERLKDYEGSPYDGIIFEYIDPVTGGSVMPTMSFRCQLLLPGKNTLAHRKTASTVYCVLEGEGYTEVEGQRFEWKRRTSLHGARLGLALAPQHFGRGLLIVLGHRTNQR